MRKIEELIKIVSRAQMEKFYLGSLLSINELGRRFNLTGEEVKLLLKEYNINIKTKYDRIKDKISKEELYQYYIVEDHSYDDMPSHYGITQWQFDKLCAEYGIKKDKSKVFKKALTRLYEESGSKEEYYKKVEESRIKNIISKYGSEEEFKKLISAKLSKSWLSKPLEERKRLAAKTLAHGGGWNYKTSLQTLKRRYGVNNSYAFATFTNNSVPNKHLKEKLDNLGVENSTEFYLHNSENKYFKYDIKVGNILLEKDPWPFHNSTFNPLPNNEPLSPLYHYNKTQLAEENNFRCIHIFDWDDEDKIVNSLVYKEKIYARKCSIKEVDPGTVREFLNSYHYQNTCRNQIIRIGLYYKEELIQLMTFGKPRYNKNYEWELLRLCTKFGYRVVGGSEKLFKYFIKNYSPKSIISYCDNSKFNGEVYIKLGFSLKSRSKNNKHWINTKTGQHITDNLLRQRGYDQLFGTAYGKGTSNEELMKQNNFVEIYDCGQSTYIWNN